MKEDGTLEPPDKRWPAQVLDTLHGELSEEALVRVIREDGVSDAREWLTEASFYIGEMRLAEGDAETARRHFASVVNLKVLNFVEYGMAARGAAENAGPERGGRCRHRRDRGALEARHQGAPSSRAASAPSIFVALVLIVVEVVVVFIVVVVLVPIVIVLVLILFFVFFFVVLVLIGVGPAFRLRGSSRGPFRARLRRRSPRCRRRDIRFRSARRSSSTDSTRNDSSSSTFSYHCPGVGS